VFHTVRSRNGRLRGRKGTRLRRFGLVTTNSLSQVFRRRVMERHLTAKPPISLLMVIPDHPWTKATRDAAAVRVAMTGAALGKHDGQLFEVTKENGLDTDEQFVELRQTHGRINADLTIGVDVTAASPSPPRPCLFARWARLRPATHSITAEKERAGCRFIHQGRPKAGPELVMTARRSAPFGHRIAATP
jgi:hypothetical protein